MGNFALSPLVPWGLLLQFISADNKPHAGETPKIASCVQHPAEILKLQNGRNEHKPVAHLHLLIAGLRTTLSGLLRKTFPPPTTSTIPKKRHLMEPDAWVEPCNVNLFNCSVIGFGYRINHLSHQCNIAENPLVVANMCPEATEAQNVKIFPPILDIEPVGNSLSVPNVKQN